MKSFCFLPSPQLSANYSGCGVCSVLPAVSQGHSEGPRWDVPWCPTPTQGPLPQKLLVAVYSQHTTRWWRAVRVSKLSFFPLCAPTTITVAAHWVHACRYHRSDSVLHSGAAVGMSLNVYSLLGLTQVLCGPLSFKSTPPPFFFFNISITKECLNTLPPTTGVAISLLHYTICLSAFTFIWTSMTSRS